MSFGILWRWFKVNKTCTKCHKTKPLDEFHNDKSRKDGKQRFCKECKKEVDKKYREDHKEEKTEYREDHKEEKTEYNRIYCRDHKEEKAVYDKEYWKENKDEMRRKRGQTSMYENKSCASYLGVVIGERLCRHLFKDVEVMPYSFSGYDIICNHGKKVNVKAACITLVKSKYSHWSFHINYNKIADFFICVAFDNVEDLNPIHMWMIPGKEVNHLSGIEIRLSTLHKWSQWERDIKDAQICCAEMKNHTKQSDIKENL